MDISDKPKFFNSDWILIIFFLIIYPLVIGATLVHLLNLSNEKISQLLVVNIIVLVFLCVSLYLYQSMFRKLTFYANLVDFYHFTPSLTDLFIHLIKQVYYVIFLGLILSFFLGFLISNSDLGLTTIVIYSIGISLFLESFLVVIRMRDKIALINTAQEPVKSDIIQEINQGFPESLKISEYRFADIQIPSLFLSAGVMTNGINSYICLVSRYFNWKLTGEELIAVLLHEVGHVTNNHIHKTYLIIGTEVFLRSIRIFIVTYLLLIFFGPLEAFKIDLFSILFLILTISVFLTSAFLTFTLKFRSYLAEIWADEFSAKRVGSQELADILRKLPQLIPSPLVYDQSSFLGFRVNLLRHSVEK